MTEPTSPTGRPNASSTSRLLTIIEVAQALHVTERHVRRLVQERRIPFIKWGHLIRFDPAELRAWVEASRVAVERGPGGIA
jgi:excisionase family DNA binding protein